MDDPKRVKKMMKKAGFHGLKKWTQDITRYINNGEECYELDHREYVDKWCAFC